LLPACSWAAEATTGSIVGRVLSHENAPIAGARIAAGSPSGRYTGISDGAGHFVILGVVPDTYVVSVQATGYDAQAVQGVAVLPQGEVTLTFHLEIAPETIARVTASSIAGPEMQSASNVFVVSAAAAQAQTPVEAGAGLAAYTRGTVQGAVATVPGVMQDQFANVIVRAGKVQDTVFNYDSVPIPQGLIAEPGGNVAGAQLATTGVRDTIVTLAGMDTQSENAIGGVVDQIPQTGTYPGTTALESAIGIGFGTRALAFESRWASPDLHARYAFSGSISSDDLLYGNGTTFYPAEAGTYGIGLSDRAQWSGSGNVHFQIDPRDDLGFVALAGEGTYDQYGSPFSGLTYGAFDGAGRTIFPGEPSKDAPIQTPSRFRGTYDVEKIELTHTAARSLYRVQFFRSEYGSLVNGPEWDDLSYPDGVISLYSTQNQRLTGASIDVQVQQSDTNVFRYGTEYDVINAGLFQVIPTAGEFITSQPTTTTGKFYVADTWSPTDRWEVKAALRETGTNEQRSNGSSYGVGSLDPHLSASYRTGSYGLRASYDVNTVVPAPLEVERVDSANPAPFVNLAPEVGQTLEFALNGGTRTRFQLAYYSELEKNLIDVLPFNYHSAIASGSSPNGVGVPTNIGELRAHGLDFWLQSGSFALTANYVRGFSSSASEFAYNDLNAPAIAAGHLFPIGYVPNLTLTASYELRIGKLLVQPSISFESGYPYGVGKRAWIFDPVTNKPELVNNDNNVNPGFSYYFLKNPAEPFNAVTNPYIGTLGTPDGDDPNTLRTPPQTLVGLHLELPVSYRVTAMVDVANLLATASPTQLQSNPYLIGPPGYGGGNAAYASYYGAQLGNPLPGGYTLGNGVPTNDGQHQIVPWTYGKAGYAASSYPQARSILLRLRWRL
jgi:hypothetical protein